MTHPATQSAFFSEHRRRFLDSLQRLGAAALIPAGVPKLRNGDSEHRFRPESDFFYLTGFGESHCTLLLLPAQGQGGKSESVLFLREKKLDEEIWTGERLGVAAAPAALGVERAFPVDQLQARVAELLRGYQRLVYRTGGDEARDRWVNTLLANLRSNSRSVKPSPTQVLDVSEVLHEQRLFKTPGEIERLRRAAAITALAHSAAMRAARGAKNECEIDALLAYEFRRQGATGSAYTNIVAGGKNALTLHYHDNDQPLEAGDLLLVDAGAEYGGYAADVTRTFPISGRFSPVQRELYEVVLAAQAAGIAACTSEHTIAQVHERTVAELVRGLAELGVLPGGAQEILRSESYKQLYMHRTSHWLGLDVHDCGAYVQQGAARRLEPGMVLTVEPGLYVRPGSDNVDPRWHGIGIRIEDDVLVTAGAPEVLTRAAPKSVDAVEAACALMEEREKGDPTRT